MKRGSQLRCASAALAGCAALLLGALEAGAQSYLGIQAKSNSNVLEQSYAFSGITVTRVVENSPAEAAGFREGDILLRANGIELSHPDRLADVIDRLPAGSRIRFRVERDRRVLELQATTVARLAAPSAAAAENQRSDIRIERRRLGIEFKDAEPERLRSLGLDARGGVELLAVASRSPLLEAGLRPGDLLFALGGEPIPSAAELSDFLAGLSQGRELVFTVYDTAGQRREIQVQTFRPEFHMKRLWIPPLLRIEREADASRYSFLLGALRVERSESGSRYRLLWLLRLDTGSPDTLEPAGG